MHRHGPRTQKIIQKPSPGSPKAPKTSPQSDPGAPKGDPGAPKERPKSVPIGFSRVQEASGRAFGRLRTSFWSSRSSFSILWGPQATQQRIPVLCSLLALLSTLLSPSRDLGQDSRPGYFDPGTWVLGPVTSNLRCKMTPTQRNEEARNRWPGGMCVAL